MLVEELRRAKERQQLLDWQANEQKLAESLGPAVKPELTQDVRDRLAIFVTFCKSNNVRHCPARPATCAAFAKAEAANGRDPQGIVSLLAAVSALHDHHSLSNPTATAAVRFALESIIKSDPPRSWGKDEKAEWALLPPDIRQAIARREEQRDQALRQAQNRLADERKRLSSGADTKPAQTNEKDYQHVSTSQV
jgi:hypothetical protein